MFYELFQLALSNLMRARLRLAMTSGGVLIGTCAVILLVGLTNGLQRSAEAGIGADTSLTEISVYPRYDPNNADIAPPQLDPALVQQLWQMPGVALVVPSKGLSAGGPLVSGDYTGGAWIQGIDPNLLPYLDLPLQEGQLSLNEGEILIGAGLGNNFYDPTAEEWQPVTIDVARDPLSLILYDQEGQEIRVNLKVAGVMPEDSKYGYSTYMSMAEVMRLNELATGQPLDPETFTYDSVLVYATDRETTIEVIEAIREMGYDASGMIDFLTQLNKFFTTMRLILGGIGGVALLVAAFGVANTMMMAILERTKEIGVFKAIGARDSDVMTVFLIEAGLVGMIGGLAGVGLSYALRDLINQAVQNMPQSESGMMFLPIDPNNLNEGLVILSSELSLLAVGLATLVGLAAGFYPAWRAANMPPVMALKDE